MKRFHLWRSLCLLALLFLCLFQIPSLAEELHPYTEVRSSYKETYWQEFVYSDKFFLTDSTAGVNPEIAKVSVSLAAGAYRPNDINSMLYQMGFSYDNFQFYERNINYNDLVAYTIGTKDIPGTTKTAVIVAIRGSAQNAEWFSNFNVGASRSDDADLFDPGDHLGFHQAASAVWDSTTSVLSTIGYEDRIVLVTGHSRGGAVANIVSAWLNESHIVPEDQLFGYTYACPNVSKNVKKDPYQNIHNFNITGDMVPAVPLRSWGYDRHGITHEITAPQKMYQTIVGREYTGASVTSHYERAFSALAATAEDLDDPLRQFMLMSVAYIMGGSADVSMEELTIKYLTDNSAFLAKMYLEKVILREFDDVQEAFEAGAEMGRATLKLIYQLQAETEGMTPEEFEEHREKNIEAYNEIMGATGVVIETLGDFPVAISVLLNAIQYADEAGEIAGMFIFQKEDTGSGSLGSTMQSIMDAHLEPVYVCYVNQEYYGYLGGIHKTRKVTLPEGVLTVGPRCFEGSAFTGFNGGSVEYIPGYSFANANQMETLLLPDTIAYIGEKAFLGNYGLKQITMPIECSGFNLFSSCPNVQTIEYTAQSDGVMPNRGDHEYDNHHYKYTLEFACRDSVEKIVYHEGVTEIANFANVHTNASKLTEISLPSTLQKIGNGAFRNTALLSPTLPQNLEIIGDHAFADCFAMTSVTIPASVATIHGSAFRNCDALTDITFHNAVIGHECFMECDGLETLVIPNNITWIGSNAFSSCKGLKTITLPIEQSGVKIFEGCSNVQAIEYTAQSDGVMPNRGDHQYDNHHYKYTLEYACRDSVEKIVYHEGVTEIANFANVHSNASKLTEISLPSTLRKIGNSAFRNTALPSFTLPQNLETIGDHAFADCFAMTSVAIPASVTTLHGSAFRNCDALTEITLHNAVIGNECFMECDGLETLVIPNNITWIGSNAFSSCKGLKTITLPIEQSGVRIFEGCSNVQAIKYTAQSTGVMPIRGDHEYDDHHYKYALEFACRSTLEKIVYHEGVTEIAAFAAFPGDNFNGSRLSEIVLPSTLRKIGHHAFCGTALPSPMLPENVETIDSYAFAGCASMTSVTIPASVISMGSGVFMNCNALTDITLKNSIIGPECFSRCDALETLVIPNAIISIGWNAFQSCLGLKHITLPIEQSGVKIFEGCSNVQTIEYTAQSTGVMPNRGDHQYDDHHYKYALEFACRSTLEKIVYHEGVTEIAAFAAFPGDNFNGSRLSEIALPSTLQKIGHHAFCGTALPSPMLPENVETIDGYAFADCFAMTSVTIPASVVSMGSGVFMNCDALTDINLKNTVIGPECFSNCDALETLVIPNTIISIGRNAFQSCLGLKHITLPIEQSGVKIFEGCSNVQTIEYTAQSTGVMPNRGDHQYDDHHYKYALEFACRSTLEKVVYHEGVTEIAAFAAFPGDNFNGSRLSEITLPSTLQKIGHHAFCGTALPSPMLPENVETIDSYAFAGCASMTSVTIPASVISMGSGVFMNCDALTDINLKNAVIGPECFSNCDALETLVIPNSITFIGRDAFTLCANLQEVTLPIERSGFQQFTGCQNVQTIRYTAQSDGVMHYRSDGYYDDTHYQYTLEFQCRNSLKKIVYDEGVTRIASFAHLNSSALAEVVFPTTLTAIDHHAFEGCPKLGIVVLGGKVNQVDNSAFNQPEMYVVCIEDSWAHNWASQKGYTALHCCQTPQVLMAQGLLPTCTQPGLSDGYTCENCGGALLTQQTIPASGHAVVLASSRYEITQGEELSIPFTLSCGGACGLNVYWHDFSGYNGMAQSSVIYLAGTPGAGEMQLWIGEDEANASSCTLIVHASEQLKVPASATELGEEAFAHIAAVEVLLPESAQSIGPRAFADCANLALITIPDSVTSIAANAFEGSDGVVILCSANSFAAQYADDTDTLWVAK